MKKLIWFMGLLFLCSPIICYGEDASGESNFDAANDLTSRYARKEILDGKTTSLKKKKNEIYLAFPFDKRPYMSFSGFVLNGPTNVYSGFIETIFYRDKIKIKDMYYEKNPVKTDKIGIYSTNLCFTSEEDVVYHYKNVPYLVSSDKPTIFFSKVHYNKENATVSGEIKMPSSKNTYQIELFYTDNDEYHYQEGTADKNGSFIIELNREGIEGKMYLRASDGLGNYADACDIDNQEITTYSVPSEALKTIKKDHKVVKKEAKRPNWFVIILALILGIFIFVLVLLRVRVIIKRHKRGNIVKKTKNN
ncbi:hypothetical protein A5881_001014 [Enterococcus termitis]|nr:hypothetical protein A5881_003243 [Enterococcus termitis]